MPNAQDYAPPVYQTHAEDFSPIQLRVLQICRESGQGEEGINISYLARCVAPEGYSEQLIRFIMHFLTVLNSIL
jgi:hypothetical protein